MYPPVQLLYANKKEKPPIPSGKSFLYPSFEESNISARQL
jgi:hypothetical protein